MWLTVDVAIDDFNWYVVMLIFMMILIWDDVANEDHVNMNWCSYWWLCEYEMRLLLLMMMSLRWDDDDGDDHGDDDDGEDVKGGMVNGDEV